MLAVCGAVAGAAACGGDDEEPMTAAETTTTTAASGAAGASTDTVEIADFKFEPVAVTVDAGTEVTWTNSDEAPHTATADDESFDTGDLDQGASGSAAFDEPGTYSYYCRFHPFMKATVEVR